MSTWKWSGEIFREITLPSSFTSVNKKKHCKRGLTCQFLSTRRCEIASPSYTPLVSDVHSHTNLPATLFGRWKSNMKVQFKSQWFAERMDVWETHLFGKGLQTYFDPRSMQGRKLIPGVDCRGGKDLPFIKETIARKCHLPYPAVN